MTVDNVKGVRHILPSHEENDTGRVQIELVPKEGTEIDERVRQFCREWGVRSRDDVEEAAKWDRAVRDLQNGRIPQHMYERGRNPNRNEEFTHPRGR